MEDESINKNMKDKMCEIMDGTLSLSSAPKYKGLHIKISRETSFGLILQRISTRKVILKKMRYEECKN